MKKLMIAAAIVCAAALANAATINWKIKELVDVDDAALSKGQVYTFCTKGTSKVTYSTMKAALEAATTIDAFNAAFADYSGSAISALSGSITTAGTFEKTGVDLKTSGVPEQEKSVKLFAVIIDNSGAPDKLNWYITDTTTGVPTPDASTTDIAEFTISGAVGHTIPESVPEPTSGLLLLLGVAGMALRRRRA